MSDMGTPRYLSAFEYEECLVKSVLVDAPDGLKRDLQCYSAGTEDTGKLAVYEKGVLCVSMLHVVSNVVGNCRHVCSLVGSGGY